MKKANITNRHLESAEIVSPGDILSEELHARGWTQGTFAEIIGKPLQSVNAIIRGKKSITPETARLFAAALGTSPELWLNLEANYRLRSLKVTPRERDASRKAMLYEKFPVQELIKRGLIEKGQSAAALEQNLCAFFGVKDISKIKRTRVKQVMKEMMSK